METLIISAGFVAWLLVAVGVWSLVKPAKPAGNALPLALALLAFGVVVSLATSALLRL